MHIEEPETRSKEAAVLPMYVPRSAAYAMQPGVSTVNINKCQSRFETGSQEPGRKQKPGLVFERIWCTL